MGANKSLLTPQCANKSLLTHSGVPITPTTIKFIIIALTDTEDHLQNIQSQGIGELPQENGKSDNSEVRFNLPVNGVFPKKKLQNKTTSKQIVHSHLMAEEIA